MAIPPQLLIALLQSGGMGLMGALGSGFETFQQAQRENERREVAARQRERLNNLLARIRHVNYDDVNSAQSAAFTEASNAAAANAAQRGLRGGVVDASQDRVLGQAIADLARFKQQQQQQREQAEGNVLEEPAFDVPEDQLNAMNLALRSGLLGFLGGSGEGISSALSSQDNIRALEQLYGGEDAFGGSVPGGGLGGGGGGGGGRTGSSPSGGGGGQPMEFTPTAQATPRSGALQASRGNTSTQTPRNDSMSLQAEPEPTSGVIGPALQRALVRSRNTRNIA